MKQSEQSRQFHTDDRQQISNARKEAEALFRPKPQLVAPPVSTDPSQSEAPARKPRILSAAPLPVTRMPEAAVGSKPQPTPAVPVSQLAHAHRERLKEARTAIFKQQNELQVKLNAIDCELRALEAYEAAKRRPDAFDFDGRIVRTHDYRTPNAAAPAVAVAGRPGPRVRNSV